MVSEAAFSAVMDRLRPFEANPLIAVAVSGGGDSLALALLLARWSASCGGRVVGLTVDHGLRPEAADEARQVQRWLAAHGIEHYTLTHRGEFSPGDIQTQAREVRYRLLLDWCAEQGCVHLALAHHQDDQAETFLLRLARGSGLAGLSAMAAISYRPQARLLRPLLPFSRQELRDWLQAQSQAWIEDPSNQNTAFARVQWRNLSPTLAPMGLTPQRLAETAERLGRARVLLEAEVIAFIARAVRLEPFGWACLDVDLLRSADEEVALRALAGVLSCVGGREHTPRFDRLRACYEAIKAKPLHRQSLHGCVLSVAKATIIIAREARGLHPTALCLDGGSTTWDRRFVMAVDPACADFYRVRGEAVLQVGPVGSVLPSLKSGHFFRSRVDVSEKSVWKSIPGIARPSLPALYEGKRLLAVPLLGWRASDCAYQGPLLRDLRFRPQHAMAFMGFRLAVGRSKII